MVSTKSAPNADGLVLFGITGDLARKKLFRSLYGLEAIPPFVFGSVVDGYLDEEGVKDGSDTETSVALEGDRRLFARGDQVERAWELVQPVLDDPVPVAGYPYGATDPQGDRS